MTSMIFFADPELIIHREASLKEDEEKTS